MYPSGHLNKVFLRQGDFHSKVILIQRVFFYRTVIIHTCRPFLVTFGVTYFEPIYFLSRASTFWGQFKWLILSMELQYKQIQHIRKCFYTILLNLAWLWSRAQLAINKKQKYFLLPDHQLAEKLILIFGLQKRTKQGKSKLVTKSVGIIVMIILFLKLLVKPWLHSVFSLIIWITKLQIKQPVKRPQQILTANSPIMGTLSEKLFNCCDNFWGFQDLLIYLVKYFFLITFNFY